MGVQHPRYEGYATKRNVSQLAAAMEQISFACRTYSVHARETTTISLAMFSTGAELDISYPEQSKN